MMARHCQWGFGETLLRYVVGLFVLVAKWMFPSGKDAPDGKELHSRAATLKTPK